MSNLNCENKQGKYFYLFAEDAIQEGKDLVTCYHRLRADTCLILEYDIPEDIIMKNIGYGDYTYDIRSLFLVETFIEKGDFGNSIVTSDQIDKNEKIRYLVESFKDSLKIMKEYQYSAFADIILL